MQRNCAHCGRPFEAQRSTKKYCDSSCRAKASQNSAPPPPPITEVGDAGRPVSGLLDAVTVELEALKKLNSVTGQHALELANRIVSAPGMNAGVAALSKELSRVLGDVRRGATATVVNPLDELKARRDLKRAAG